MFVGLTMARLDKFVGKMVSFFLLGTGGLFYGGNAGHQHVAIIVLYALTAGVAGFVAAAAFKKFQGDNWVHNVLQTAVLLALPFFLVFCVENTIAWYNDVTTALPAPTILFVAAVWARITVPLTGFGALAGRRRAPPPGRPALGPGGSGGGGGAHLRLA